MTLTSSTWAKTREPARPQALAQPGVHTCPVTNCPTLCSPGHLSCKTHWMALKQKDRHRLARSFRARQTNPEGYTAAVQWALWLLANLNQTGEPAT